MNQIKYKTSSKKSIIDVDEEVTAIYHNGTELISRLFHLEQANDQTHKILRAIEVTQNENEQDRKKRKIIDRSWAFGSFVGTLLILGLASWAIHMQRECVDKLNTLVSSQPPAFKVRDPVNHKGTSGVIVSRYFVDDRWVYKINTEDGMVWRGQGGLLK